MQARDIRQHIIIPTLKIVDLWSPAAEILVYGTGFIESNYYYTVQIGNVKNGGLGYWQMEPSDFKDICVYLRNNFNKGLLDRVLAACYYTILPTDPKSLISNIKLAMLFCRVHYWRIKAPLPAPTDAFALAEYHYKYYNGDGLGKTHPDKNTIVFQQIIDGNL